MEKEIPNSYQILSVIIPTYKPTSYIWNCLNSLVNQTLSKEKYELILVLNGCNEPYYSEIKFYLNTFSFLRFRLLQTDEGGVSNARNIGIEEAKGDYITFVDDDDFVSPSYLQELLAKANADTVVISNELRYNEKDDTTSEESWSIEYKKKAPQGRQPYPGTRKFFSGPCMKLIHRDIIASYRFDTRFTNGEDSLFMFAISANMKYVDFTSPNAIYYRRVREGSAMSKERKTKAMVKNRIRMIGEFIRIYRKNPYAYSFRFLTTRIFGCLHSILNSLKPFNVIGK